MTPVQFAALTKWIKAEAKLAMAERTYQNDRAIGEVAAKATKAELAAADVLIDER